MKIIRGPRCFFFFSEVGTVFQRTKTLGNTFLKEGLLTAFMQANAGTYEEAQAFVEELGAACPTWRTYEELQKACAPKILVDKTPRYSDDRIILERAEQMFRSAFYLHLVRHPIANIASEIEFMEEYHHTKVTWAERVRTQD